MNNYWKNKDYLSLEKTETFSEIGEVALEVQLRMPDKICQICGPISTGGYGNIKQNIQIFSAAIQYFNSKEEIIYNQLPLEESLVRIIKKLGSDYNPYDLLENIYRPLFQSGKLNRTYFIYNWESSQGSQWEHEEAYKNGLEIHYLNNKFGFIE